MRLLDMPTPLRLVSNLRCLCDQLLDGGVVACLVCLGYLTVVGNSICLAGDTGGDARQALDEQFAAQVRPFIIEHCGMCHDTQTREAGLDLTGYDTLTSVIAEHELWQTVLERLQAEDMPPADSGVEVDAKDRQQVIAWIATLRDSEAAQHAGDPGEVLARRLSNVEYDNTIRDLTGFDIRPTRNFPVDPANEAGFDNSGESLAMSPALMNKYLDAAELVADHLVFAPDSLRFAPHPVATDTDRDKYCVNRIVQFYYDQPTKLADYFLAAWEYQRNAPGPVAEGNRADLEMIARRREVSEEYLQRIYAALTQTAVEHGPLARLQSHWQTLVQINERETAEEKATEMAEYVERARKEFEPHIENLDVDSIHKGAQAFVLWKNRQYEKYRRQPDFGSLQKIRQVLAAGHNAREPESNADQQRPAGDEGPIEDGDADIEATKDKRLEGHSTDDEPSEVAEVPEDFEQRVALLNIPREADTWEGFEEDCRIFCSIFPDAFYVSERGRDYLGKPREQQEKGRLLNAGFHSMMGYYRDDTPLMEMVLNDEQCAELDRLWEELDYFTSAPIRQYQGFLWFERTDSGYLRDPEFDFARPENRDSLQPEQIARLSELYLAKAKRKGAGEVPLEAIRHYFKSMNRKIRWVEQRWAESESVHLDALIEFASRAFRRPLTDGERESLRAFYHRSRRESELSHQEAIRDTLVSILVSPKFCYRLDLLSDSDQERALNDFELASRLSYFLWAAPPDEVLLEEAAKNELHRPEVLEAQVTRMLRDRRVRGLATEFLANWLDIRRFEEHNAVDRERYPDFDDDLRWAMFEEPIRFFMDLAGENASVNQLLYADHTWVNEQLAKYYGIEQAYNAAPHREDDGWKRVERVDAVGRGGLLPMAVFLTKNSPGLRTSPVKRGYWVARRVLGEHIPPPPPNVPDLPEDEAELGELTLREVLARHRDHASCAGCHQRFDSLGIVFEGFGPAGELRTEDFGGREVDITATFPDGSERTGLQDLRQYILEERQRDFEENFCRKLLTFALCRSLQLSDQPLVEGMLQSFEDPTDPEPTKPHRQSVGRLKDLIMPIVTSRQFLHKRGIAEDEENNHE